MVVSDSSGNSCRHFWNCHCYFSWDRIWFFCSATHVTVWTRGSIYIFFLCPLGKEVWGVIINGGYLVTLEVSTYWKRDHRLFRADRKRHCTNGRTDSCSILILWRSASSIPLQRKRAQSSPSLVDCWFRPQTKHKASLWESSPGNFYHNCILLLYWFNFNL